MRKPRLVLLSDKGLKKKYSKFFVFMIDESVFEYGLNEWDVYRDEEWITVEKLDKSEMDSFATHHILRVRFVHPENKSQSMQEIIVLKPVPPDNAA